MEETDEDLLRSWLMGDAKAFEKFYLRHSGKVFGYARKRGIPQDEISELVQEVFLKLHLHISQYEPEKKALPWFFTMVHNCCVDRLKRGGKAKQAWQSVSLDSLKQELPSESPSSSDFADESRQTLGRAMNSLSLEQKKVLNMRIEDGMSFEEIASATGKSSAALRKAYSRALRMLQSWFEREKIK